MHKDKELAHNDIKLQNILLFFNQNDSSDLTAKLIDFGLASSTSVDSSTICKYWVNRSPNNLPPEIIEELNRSQNQTEQSEVET
jgi:serine/threonine protein kinase